MSLEGARALLNGFPADDANEVSSIPQAFEPELAALDHRFDGSLIIDSASIREGKDTWDALAKAIGGGHLIYTYSAHEFEIQWQVSAIIFAQTPSRNGIETTLVSRSKLVDEPLRWQGVSVVIDGFFGRFVEKREDVHRDLTILIFPTAQGVRPPYFSRTIADRLGHFTNVSSVRTPRTSQGGKVVMRFASEPNDITLGKVGWYEKKLVPKPAQKWLLDK